MSKPENGLKKVAWKVQSPGFLVILAALVGMLAGLLLWANEVNASNILQWLTALLPGSIILAQLVYLVSSRRKQYRDALGPMKPEEVQRLEDLYFALGPLTLRYVVPAILVTVLCGTITAAVIHPHEYFPWLYSETWPVNSPAGPASKTIASNANQPAGQPEGNVRTPNPNDGTPPTTPLKTETQSNTPLTEPYWPKADWRRQTLRGAALGFLGAYVYLLLLLTDRAFQRDITTGIAIWAAAMPALGLIMGGLAALIVASALGANDTSWTRDAIFLVAGMLPRQFAALVQSGVQKMFQQSPPTTRTLPLTTLRGVGPAVSARLEEEGIHDVSALAYASPHQLIRLTTYSPRQIVDWIDEALLVATLPANWEALEKAGVTGALDLAWYQDHPDLIPALADEVKLSAPLLAGTVTRLSQDAQVDDLHQLYWDKTVGTDYVSLRYRFRSESSTDVRAALASDVQKMKGVRSVQVVESDLVIDVDSAQREGIDGQLRANSGLEPQG